MLKAEVGWPGWAGLVNLEGFLGTLAWYALSVVLLGLLPAYEVEGVELKIGGKLKYRLNGLYLKLVIICVANDQMQAFSRA